MSFETHIQQWVNLDNQLKQQNDNIKELRSKKSELSNKIQDSAIELNYIDTQINISDGKLKLSEVKQTSPLTLSFIKTCLHEIISNDEKVDQIMTHIKSRRETKSIFDIKRTYSSSK